MAELIRSRTLALLVDLDGTLVPFARTPAEARIDDEAARILCDLGGAGVQVVVVSGRPREAIEPVRSVVPGAWWFAEHGSWRCDADGWQGPGSPAIELAALAGAWAPLAARTPGAWIEGKSLSLCFHFRDVPLRDRNAILSQVEMAADEWLESEPEFERLPGACALEVRRRGIHKGLAVAWVRSALPEIGILALGDDLTDEDMFAALGPSDAAILASVSSDRPSRAALWVDGPAEVRRLLRWVVEARSGGAPAPAGLLKARRSLVRAPTGAARLLVMSNRTPGSTGGGRTREVGGLVSALEPALRERDGIWLGWSGRERDGELALVLDEEGMPRCASFDYPPAWRRRFYAGLCNRALWPLVHGLVDRVHYEDADWAAYVEANAAYARLARDLVGETAMVWVHDYHLFLAGRALRQAGHRGPIGLFVHVPFPARDDLETFPWARELLEAMDSFDLIGFHCERWAESFRDCRAALVPVPSSGRHHAAIEVFPLGVEQEAFAPPGGTQQSAEASALHADLSERRLLLGVDRLDYSKGIPERLRAYERLLETFAEWRGKIVFAQISVPSRDDVPDYAELRRIVENLVGRINGRFGEADWVPVRYLFRSYDHPVLADLYRAAAVAVVTPLRDGMNLVAKEFVAAQRLEDPGVLVLSRFAGAAVELADAILTNPFHIDGLAADLDRALRMPLEERRAVHRRLVHVLEDTSPSAWASRFLARLDRAGGARDR